MKSCHYGVAEEYFQSSADYVKSKCTRVSQGYMQILPVFTNKQTCRIFQH